MSKYFKKPNVRHELKWTVKVIILQVNMTTLKKCNTQVVCVQSATKEDQIGTWYKMFTHISHKIHYG